MKIVGNVKLIALVLGVYFLPSVTIPSILIGKWDVGAPYDTPGPIGIDAKQEKYIRSLSLVYAPGHLRVCGKEIQFESIETKSLTNDEFLQAYGFLPHVIGMETSSVLDLTINPSDGMNACGEYEDPGVHVMIDRHRHVVMEVANSYFRLKKR